MIACAELLDAVHVPIAAMPSLGMLRLAAHACMLSQSAAAMLYA